MAIAKSNIKLIAIAKERQLIVGRVIKEKSKEIISKMKQRILRAISSQGAIKKSPTLLLQYRKKS